jgi:plastocyanin
MSATRLVLIAAALTAAGGAALLTVVLSGPAHAGTNEVLVGPLDMDVFGPPVTTVNKNTTVTWTWASDTHSVSSAPTSGETFDSGILNTDASFSHAFDVEGEYFYYCTVHASPDDATDQGIAEGAMVGKVVVTEPAPLEFDLFEGWNLVAEWPGPELSDGQAARGTDEITAFFEANIDPPIWDALAAYDPSADMWGQHFADPPLPAFQTLDTLSPGDDLWIFVLSDATLSIP